MIRKRFVHRSPDQVKEKEKEKEKGTSKRILAVG
jgi:hypothetical protein